MSERTVYRIHHQTTYQYSLPVRLSHQVLHLTPRELPWQQCLSHTVNVLPSPQLVRSYEDNFGNVIKAFSLDTDHTSLDVQADSWVALTPRAQPQPGMQWEEAATVMAYHGGRIMAPGMLEASNFLFESSHVRIKREFIRYAAECFSPGLSVVEGVRALMMRIHEEFAFDPAATTVSTPVTEVFTNRRGVCQDFAHLMLSCLRSIGLAARYVSGYLLTEPPPGQPRLIGADASHAWVSVYCPGVDGSEGTWIDADPTNGVFPDTSHITLGWGRDFLDISPLRGVLIGGGQQTMQVAVTVLPGEEAQGLQLSI
ncbi:transglutaminase family protein [Herbaspirillum huttiense F1]|uniref:transglutaminase family protein n=1 Tax=Herbaspirillum huttiense TaxID=863372 RepID=UPI001065DEDC|nr:transglutaminase family protein [Herbaspirillum huttiense]MDT0357690.1 transglutaminase family protein [Herbaspirillum huttiense F1]QBP74145.1 transglutaminase family protein [Herbaspirillum huttiense]